MSPAGTVRTVPAAAGLMMTLCCWDGPRAATRLRSQAWSPPTARSFSCIATGCSAPAVAAYVHDDDGPGMSAYGIMVLTVDGGHIIEITGFADPALFPVFGLPMRRQL
jgi:hypothetical protein